MFKEWTTAKKMTMIEIQPGTPLRFGKIGEQKLEAVLASSGKDEVLATSTHYDDGIEHVVRASSVSL